MTDQTGGPEVNGRRRAGRFGSILLFLLAGLLAAVLAVLAVGAMAAKAAPVIEQPTPGSHLATAQPTISGSTADELDSVSVAIYEGGSAEGSPVQTLLDPLPLGGSWQAGAEPGLGQGEYTAVASQTPLLQEPEPSGPVSFVIDTVAPAVSIEGVASPSNDTEPVLKGAAGTAAGDSGTVTVTLHQGASVSGATLGSHQVSVSGGRWGYQWTGLGEGTYTAQVTQSDWAGNTGEDSTTFTIVTAAPQVTINGFPEATNDTTPTFTGTGSTGAGDDGAVRVTVRQNGSTVADGEVPLNSGNWSYTAPGLGDGTYSVSATQGDQAGNTGESGTEVFTVDTVAPAVGIEGVASPSNNTTPLLKGAGGTATGDAGTVTVTLHQGSSVSGTVLGSHQVSVAGGRWQYQWSALGEGTYTAQVTQSDWAGNKGEGATTFVILTAAPKVTINAVPEVTRDSTPTFTGTGSTGSGDAGSVTVTIRRNGSGVAGGEVPLNSGNWTYTPPALPDGTYSVVATQGDQAGNTGESQTEVFTVDTTPPAVGIEGVASPSNDTSPLLKGPGGTATGDSGTVTVTLHQGASVSGATIGSHQVSISAGRWQYQWTGLGEGTYTAQVTQSDWAGNTGEGATTFTIVTAAPKVSINTVAEATNDPTPSFTGSGSTGSGDEGAVTVTIKSAGTTVASGQAPLSGTSWSYTAPTLGQGTYTVQATQRDQEGNVGESATEQFTVDTTKPALSIVALESPSRDAKPLLTGNGGVARGDAANVTVTLHAGASVSGVDVGSPQNVGVSGGTWRLQMGELADGIYTAQVVQSDWAGNVAEVTETFQIATTAPTVTIATPAPDSNDSTPTLTGTASTGGIDETTVTVSIRQNSTTVASGQVPVLLGHWTYTPAKALADGTYSAKVTQKDQAGNVGEATSPTFTIDTTAPAVTMNPIATPSKNTQPTIAGIAGSASGDEGTVTLTLHQGASIAGPVVGSPVPVTANGEHHWSHAVSPALAEGEYTAQVTQKDQAGNVGEAEPQTFNVLTAAPAVTIAAFASITNNPRPAFSGTGAAGPLDEGHVTVTIHHNGGTVGSPAEVRLEHGAWSYIAPTLGNGTYTLSVAQSDDAGNVGEVTSEAFLVDITPPAVTITFPTKGQSIGFAQPTLKGKAGVEPGDQTTVDVSIYALNNKGVAEKLLETREVTANGAEWSTEPLAPALAKGNYLAVAEQEDEARNIGRYEVPFEIETTAPAVRLEASGFVTRGTALVSGPAPSFHGTGATESEDGESVVVNIYDRKSDAIVASYEVPLGAGGSWSLGPVAALSEGVYEVQAEQEGPPSEQTGYSDSLPFTVDATPPAVTLTSPAAGAVLTGSSQTVAGAAGTAPGDAASVTVRLYGGGSAGGEPLSTISAPVSGGGWSGSFGGLEPGTYAAQAEQVDDVGNRGLSKADVFTVAAPVLTPPSPSFTWIPAHPSVGESVSLASTSTSGSSPIEAYAWETGADALFTPGPSVITKTFASAGTHVVRLRVTDTDGQSAIASGSIVVSAPVKLMRPFPVVRIAGVETRTGATIKTFSIRAPRGAQITITCSGAGCPARSLTTNVGQHSRSAFVTVGFGRFQRSLHAGVTLTIRVTKAGAIGKYTRFTVRRNKLPARVDRCVLTAASGPISCPSS